MYTGRPLRSGPFRRFGPVRQARGSRGTTSVLVPPWLRTKRNTQLNTWSLAPHRTHLHTPLSAHMACGATSRAYCVWSLGRAACSASRARSNAPRYVTQQLPCNHLRGLFFLKLNYLGPTCRRSKMIPFLLIWIHMSESGDELGPIFAVHEAWIF